MAEEIVINSNLNKSDIYQQLLPQIEALVVDEPDIIANLSNIAAALKQAFGFFWVGFYIVKNDELVLGPFQGPVACTRIRKGRGVCGTSWLQKSSIIVEDVDKFPGHISCNSASKSEIVVPVLAAQGEVAMIIDVDSDEYSCFDHIDQTYLEALAKMIAGKL